MVPPNAEATDPRPLTERQRIEAAVYNHRVREHLAALSDAELRVDPSTPPFPNREHVETLSLALALLGSPKGQRVLEVGSGSGALSVYLALNGAIASGIDVSEENVSLAQRRAAVNGVADQSNFRAVPIEHLDDPDGSYDFIIGNAVVHHFELEDALPNIRRLLRPAGRAAFCEPVLLVPRPIRRLRDSAAVTRIVPKAVDTPTERSLWPEDVELIRRTFPTVRLHPVQLLARLQNMVNLSDAWFSRLATTDRFLLRRFPRLWPLSRYVVFDIANEPGGR